MVYDIIIGRDEADRKRYGKEGVIFLGKSYVKMGQTTSLSNNVYLDVNRAHTIMLCGKRGSGKSYSLGVIAEEMVSLHKEIRDKLSVLILDTMGIFWTMKYPNTKDEDLLESWGLKPKRLKDIQVFIPEGYFSEYKEKGMLVDKSFSIKPSELKGDDWCNVFSISLNEPLGILIERVIESFKKRNYTIQEIIERIKQDEKSNQEVKNAAENRFLAAEKWGLFSDKGTAIKDIISTGKVSILDVSCYTGVYGMWGIRSLVIGLIARKLFNERMIVRKKEEMDKIKGEFLEEKKSEMPIVWILIDEAHEFIGKERTAATDSLIQVIREGRQPGISLILATQQPGEMHKDVITQSDIIISHRITARVDIEALNNMMQTYLIGDIQKYLNNLPDLKGGAVILDDNSERMYPVQIRPKYTWHGGETPTILK